MTQADKKAEFDKQIDEIKDDANNLVEEYDCDVYRNPLIDKAVKLAIEYGKGEERERILSIINTLYADWMKEMPCNVGVGD